MELDSNISFEPSKGIINRLDSSEYFIRFQEYYKGVPVKGGGYTEGYYTHPGGPGDPCLEGFSVMPYILTGIDLDLTDVKNVTQIANDLGITPLDSSSLWIDFDNGCNYLFFYEITYLNSSSNYITSVVNAITSEVIGEINGFEADIPAVTQNFGTQIMDDSYKNPNTTWLVSDNGVLHTYDMDLLVYYDDVSDIVAMGALPSEDFIPTVSSNANMWPDGIETTYQTHWIANGMLALWISDFNVVFEKCHFLTRTIIPNAGSLKGNTLKMARFFIGEYVHPGGTEYTWAWPSTIAHEMTHALLHEVGLGYDREGEWPNEYSAPNGSLHEGIADMFGVYLESRFLNAEIDWIHGEEGHCCERDFANPTYDCFTEVEDNSEFNAYLRSDPLRYWFYLCVNGDVNLEIPAINVEKVLEIVLLASTEIDPRSDYKELMNGTLDQTLQKYGRCSNEFLALSRAWEAICVPTGFVDPITHEIPQCNFSLVGPTWVCEESNYLNVYLDNYFSSYHYIWTLIGKKSTEYESTFGMTGNGQYGGNNIELIQFPTHNYYPQNLTIKVYCPALGSQYIAKHTVKLIDCDNDDPTCEEYYNNFSIITQPLNIIEGNTHDLELIGVKSDEIHHNIANNKQYSYSRIYSVVGQLLYSGDISSMNFDSIIPNSLLVFVHYDQYGKIMHAEKKIYRY
jgi:hypothetical protein